MKNKLQSGFTLVELIIVLTIIGVLFSMTTINLLGAYATNSLVTTVSTIQADLKQQQLKSMVGDTEGVGSADDYGIYFPDTGTSYILIKGNTYSESDPNNFEIDLSNDLQFSSIQVQGSQVIFAKNSGEFSNHVLNFDYVTLRNINTDETKTIRLNELGTVISVY